MLGKDEGMCVYLRHSEKSSKSRLDEAYFSRFLEVQKAVGRKILINHSNHVLALGKM